MTSSPEIATLPGAEVEIPREVARLYDLAYNLWWTWSPGAHLLFGAIDPARWVRTRNPVELLLGVEPHMWDALLQNESFMSGYHTVIGEFDRYLERKGTAWFRKTDRWRLMQTEHDGLSVEFADHAGAQPGRIRIRRAAAADRAALDVGVSIGQVETNVTLGDRAFRWMQRRSPSTSCGDRDRCATRAEARGRI